MERIFAKFPEKIEAFRSKGSVLVGDVRGSHFMMCTEYVANKQTREVLPDGVNIGKRISNHCEARGLIVRPLAHLNIMSPALVMTEAEVDVYVTEYSRTQFTGALQGYRVRRGTDPKTIAEMLTFAGRTIDVPSIFIAGKSDWGVYQVPGGDVTMQKTACTQMVGFHLIEGAGHWVQQEQPESVSELFIQFLRDQSQAGRRL